MKPKPSVTEEIMFLFVGLVEKSQKTFIYKNCCQIK